MSTLEDFKNAPFGATATQEETRARAFRLHREFGETWIVAEMDGTFDVFESEELVCGGFILDPLPSRPTSARGALNALQAVLDLHKPEKPKKWVPVRCNHCRTPYPCLDVRRIQNAIKEQDA